MENRRSPRREGEKIGGARWVARATSAKVGKMAYVPGRMYALRRGDVVSPIRPLPGRRPPARVFPVERVCARGRRAAPRPTIRLSATSRLESERSLRSQSSTSHSHAPLFAVLSSDFSSESDSSSQLAVAHSRPESIPCRCSLGLTSQTRSRSSQLGPDVFACQLRVLSRQSRVDRRARAWISSRFANSR